MKSTDVPGLKVAELKEALKERGLSTTGVKAVLAERLLAALEEVSFGGPAASCRAAERRMEYYYAKHGVRGCIGGQLDVWLGRRLSKPAVAAVTTPQ